MRRCAVVPGFLIALSVPLLALAEPPSGSYVIDVGGAQSILLPSDFSEAACESSDGTTICIDGALATAGSGVVTGSALAEVTGLTTGTLDAAITGNTGGTTANTKVRLALVMAGALTQDGLTLDFEAKGKLKCSEAAGLPGVGCSGRLRLCAFQDGKKVGCASDRLEFEADDDGGPWQLRMDLATDSGGGVSGTAEVELATGEILDYAVDGKYAAKSDTAILRLTGTSDASGSKLKLSKLTLAGGIATGGKLVFKIAGQKGKLVLPGAAPGAIDGVTFPGHGQCIRGGYCDTNSETEWIFSGYPGSDPLQLSGETIFFGNLGSPSRPRGRSN